MSNEKEVRVGKAGCLGCEEEARHGHNEAVVLVQGIAGKEAVEKGGCRCNHHLWPVRLS
jgi:hypothetical protein